MSVSDVFDLLRYWDEAPPTHIHLLRFFGNGRKAKGPDEETARKQMNELAAFTGSGAKPLPDNLKEMIRSAEKLKLQHRGL